MSTNRGIRLDENPATFRVRVGFPRSNTRATAYVIAQNRTQARMWAKDYWSDPAIHSIQERVPPAGADVHDATD